MYLLYLHRIFSIYDMNNFVKLLLSEFISQPEIVASWGMTLPIVTDKAVSFNVCGFKYEGRITLVSVNDSSWSVRLGNSTYSCIPTKDIVKFLDSMIERTDDYLSDLRDWL